MIYFFLIYLFFLGYIFLEKLVVDEEKRRYLICAMDCQYPGCSFVLVIYEILTCMFQQMSMDFSFLFSLSIILDITFYGINLFISC